MTRGEIEKKVYEKFPVTKAERRCQEEKKIMNGLREKYRKELMAEKEKKEYK